MSSSNAPCAACKFLRRKCTQECVFAPYFPPDQPQKFANVHKVFGASNVSKLLNELTANDRNDAVNSLAYEAECRLRDPVYGCVGFISMLQQQLKKLQSDLHNARIELASYMVTAPPPPNINNINPGMLPIPAASSSYGFAPIQQQLFEQQDHQQEVFRAYDQVRQSQPRFNGYDAAGGGIGFNQIMNNNNNNNNNNGGSNLTLGNNYVDNSSGYQIQSPSHNQPIHVQLFLQPQQHQQLENQNPQPNADHDLHLHARNNNINIGPSC